MYKNSKGTTCELLNKLSSTSCENSFMNRLSTPNKDLEKIDTVYNILNLGVFFGLLILSIYFRKRQKELALSIDN